METPSAVSDKFEKSPPVSWLPDIRPNFPAIWRLVVKWAGYSYIVGMFTYFISRGLYGDLTWRISLVNSFAYIGFIPLPFILYGALKLRIRSVLWGLLPIIGVLLAWFVPYYLPKAHAAPTGTTLRFLTLNVWGNNHELSHVEDWIRQNQPDIVTLQEVSPAYATGSLPNLRDIYPYQSSQPDNTRWGGNITLSRFPILSTEYIDLHTTDDANPERIVLDVNGQQVTIYNVHLAWPAGNASGDNDHPPPPVNNFYVHTIFSFDDSLRNQQINGLLEQIKTEPNPFIVAGDFNTSDFSATYNHLAAVMHDSFREAGWGLGGSWPVARARGLPFFVPPLIRIDYIWHSDSLQTLDSWQGPPVGSDHLPLFATLDLKPNAAG